MYQIEQIKLNIDKSNNDLYEKIAKILNVNINDLDLSSFKILKKSLDARDKNNLCFVYNVVIGLNKKFSIKNKKVEKYEEKNFNPIIGNNNYGLRPLIVGFGPAGLFASYIFVLNGIKPIILERGKCIEERVKDTEKFFSDLVLNEESNVSFGEGGAGAFSDGKLNTNNKDRFGIHKFILETFHKFGANDDILYDNFPHIGSDKLLNVIKNMRNEILNMGAEIIYNKKFTFDEYKNYSKENPIILAIGNSSRDTFKDLLNNGFDLKPKPFAVGYRIAHTQNFINESQYGKNNLDKINILGAANYKLVYNVDKNYSVYSFCMCPGGYIINSSNYKNLLSINGMSYNKRNGEYANSAIVQTIKPSDYCFDGNVLAGVSLQEKIEKKAYDLCEGYIPYMYLNNNEKIIEDNVFKGKAKYCENLLSVYDDIGIDINKNIFKAINYFEKRIEGFDKNAILAGVETRTSSPVSLSRNENYMCNVKNFYPCGEGLGHGGGIMSCAVDGINVAIDIIRNL